jgi:hypothetical protein
MPNIILYLRNVSGDVIYSFRNTHKVHALCDHFPVPQLLNNLS